jgi:hypothetical protein
MAARMNLRGLYLERCSFQRPIGPQRVEGEGSGNRKRQAKACRLHPKVVSISLPSLRLFSL